MAITPGTRIGPYEVTSQLGEGAMGVVLRARDTKLLRDVALKVLPDHFADDPDRLSRLQREAQVLASLNHPNIAHIYGLEQIGTAGCIVMELVEGETLADRLKNGAVPLDEALEIAKQIADALAAAHERGIVHRDLKPANIKMTPNGTVKVLDFGLAKTLSGRSAEMALSMMATKIDSSVAGSVTGTVAYMSPEQARGKEVDARTDVWAFGCVLYELLTGRQAFHGDTFTDTVARIVTGQPDLDLLPPEVPSSVRLLLAATLNKSIQQRLQHIGDMRLFLDQKFFPTAEMPAAAAVSSQRPRSSKLWIAASFAAGLVVALALAALYMRSGTAPNAPGMRFEIALPNYFGSLSISPDGQRIAYIAQPQGDNRALWIRPVGAETAQKLAGTDKLTGGALWSPDNRYIAFISDGKLKKIDVTTAAIQVLCDAAAGPGASWGRDGVILFVQKNVIVRVPDGGGAVTPVTQLDASRKETLHALPAMLPDGKHFLYAIVSSVPENSGIFVSSLDDKTKTRLLPLSSGRLNNLAFAPPGYLMLAGETLTAQRFDSSRLTLEGSPVAIADGIDGSLSVSNTGLLFYRKASATSADKQLTWYDHSGKSLGHVGEAANYGDVEISPKGDRVAVDTITNNNRDVWIIDIARGVPSRLTFDPLPDWTPVWSPDGSRIAFASGRNGTHIYQKSSTGVGNDELMFKSDSSEIPVYWSPDGRYIVFSRLKPNGAAGVDTWLLSLSGSEPKASPFIESPFDKAQARVSPDGRWIVYATNDSGTYQIVVQSFPDPNGGKWQITAQGGIEPKWSRNGRELYYLAFDGKLMAVPIKSEPTFEAGTPIALFETPLTVNRNQSPRDRRYDVAVDGRFLISVPLATAVSIPVTAVVNWPSGLEKN
jgi:serine/threonine protein kinase/Tol biopolymer transport system component